MDAHYRHAFSPAALVFHTRRGTTIQPMGNNGGIVQKQRDLPLHCKPQGLLSHCSGVQYFPTQVLTMSVLNETDSNLDPSNGKWSEWMK